MIGKTEVHEEKPVPVPIRPSTYFTQIAVGLQKASAVKGRRVTAWAKTRSVDDC
jgi:hypothetical protein